MRDPAFLFYDGDAARDVSHMNRLERGCYFDLIQAQRKFGGYTVEQARKILGSDFDSCWGSLELILSRDGDTFFISWLKDSIQKRQDFSVIQKKRIQDYWNRKKQKSNNKNTKPIPRNIHGVTVDIPLENENENENENEIINKNVKGKDLDFSFVEPDFSEAFTEWVDYKRSKGQTYKNQKSLEACYFNLIKLSGKDPPFAREIVFHSIANNYAGLYKPKNSEANDTKQYILNRLAGTV